jgi:transcription initiation factor TFIIIB Brf1 subunit/transcription initiation factor TFIIB
MIRIIFVLISAIIACASDLKLTLDQRLKISQLHSALQTRRAELAELQREAMALLEQRRIALEKATTEYDTAVKALSLPTHCSLDEKQEIKCVEKKK